MNVYIDTKSCRVFNSAEKLLKLVISSYVGDIMVTNDSIPHLVVQLEEEGELYYREGFYSNETYSLIKTLVE